MTRSCQTVQIGLISPRLSSLHFDARKLFRFDNLGKFGILGKQAHVYAAAKVYQLDGWSHVFGWPIYDLG
jgi:hypothetical protein